MMGLKRMRAHAALHASIFGVTLIVSLLGVGIGGYLSGSAVTGVRDGFTAATGTDGAVRVEVRRAAPAADGTDGTTPAAAQDAAVRDVVAALAPGAVSVSRSVQGSALATSAGPIIATSVDLDNRATLVAGTWAAGASEAMLQADAAAALHLAPGDTVRLADGPTLTVAGTWAATDPLDPFWFADPLVATGSDADGSGPLVIDESVWDDLEGAPFARWTVTADADGVLPGQLSGISALPTGLPDALDANEAVGSTGTTVSGGLGATADELRSSLAAVGGVSPVALLLIVTVSLVTLTELGRLLAGVRAGETALLRSRGAAAPGIAATTAAGIAAVAVPAAIVGAALAVGIVLASTGRLPDVATIVVVPLATALLAIGLATAASAASARTALRRDTANDSGRGQSAAGIGLVVIVVGAAAFAVWQFRLYGSPLVRSPDGQYAADPVAVLAAPLALLAVAVLALALFPVFARLVATLAGRTPGLSAVLPARQLARRLAVFATPVLIVALACGGVTVAAAYSASWESATETTRAVRNGADVRLVQPANGGLDASAALKLPGVTAALPALAVATTLGDDAVSLVAVDADASSGPSTSAPPAPFGAAVPDGATTLTVDVRLKRAAWDSLSVNAWIAGADAMPLRIPLDTVTQPAVDSGFEPAGFTARTFSGTVPTGSWRVVAVEAVLPSSSFHAVKDADTFSIALSGLRAGTGSGTGSSTDAGSASDATPLDLGERWQPQRGLTFDGELGDGDSGDAASLNSADFAADGRLFGATDATVRFMPDSASALSLTITDSLARRTGIGVGDPATLAFADSGRTVTGTVVATAPVVAGMAGDYAVHAPFAALEIEQLRVASTPPDATELWITSTEPTATASAIRSQLGGDTRVTTAVGGADDALLGSARIALWWGAIGALLLATIAVSAVAGALLRARSGEVIILRAVGVSARQQASGRRRELLLLLSFAVVAGTIGGFVVSQLTVGGLAGSTVLDPLTGFTTAVRFDALWLAAALVAAIASLAAVVAIYGLRIGRQASALSAREEVR